MALARVEPSDSGPVVVDPVAGIRFAQRAVPLKIRIDKLGTARLVNEHCNFDLKPANGSGSTVDVLVSFSPGQFFDLSADEQLRAPAAEQYVGGWELSGTDRLQAPEAARVVMKDEYETVSLLESKEPVFVKGQHSLPELYASAWYRRGLANPASPHNFGYIDRAQLKNRITVSAPEFVVPSKEATNAGVQPQIVGTFGKVRDNIRRGKAKGSIFASHVAGPGTFSRP